MQITGKSLLEGTTLEELEQLLTDNPYLRGYVQGYLAEGKLIKFLSTVPGIQSVVKIADSTGSHGDLAVKYRDVDFIVEAKCVSSRGLKDEPLIDTWTGRVCNKRTSRKNLVNEEGESFSTHYTDDLFDGLAICTFSATGVWDFLFIDSSFIPRSNFNKGLMKTEFKVNPVDTPGLTSDISLFLERIYKLRMLKSEHDANDRRPDNQQSDQLLQGPRPQRSWDTGQPDIHPTLDTDQG